MIAVFKDVLREPEVYRTQALASTFQSMTFGDSTFHDIGLPPDSSFPVWFAKHFPDYEPTVTFLRKSPKGQAEPNFIHNDVDMGDVTAILYLNADPPREDGTSFWENNGHRLGPLMAGDKGKTGDWQCWRKVEAGFNRAVVFSAPLYHSRSMRENYGEGDEARLIQVLFARGRK